MGEIPAKVWKKMGKNDILNSIEIALRVLKGLDLKVFIEDVEWLLALSGDLNEIARKWLYRME